jgi:hypothetical protein
MPKNPPPPSCPKCHKPMHFVLVKTGGRKFCCIDCEMQDPLVVAEVANLIEGALRPRSDRGSRIQPNRDCASGHPTR